MVTSESYAKTMEQNWGEAAFKIDWVLEDPEAKISVEQRLEWTNKIKADLLANLGTLAAVAIGPQFQQAAAPDPHGATVIADGLMEGCGANPYCFGAAVALRASDAIFGSSPSTPPSAKKLHLTPSSPYHQ